MRKEIEELIEEQKGTIAHSIAYGFVGAVIAALLMLLVVTFL